MIAGKPGTKHNGEYLAPLRLIKIGSRRSPTSHISDHCAQVLFGIQG